jgi:hypothetical protein
MQIWTEQYLTNFFTVKSIVGFTPVAPLDIDKILGLSAGRTSPGKQIWSVGCSVTHGIGVDQSQRYGQLIADKTKLPISFLTQPGSSIQWAADQILRSDIQNNDVVIWGLTSNNRFPIFEDNEVGHILANAKFKTFSADKRKLLIDRLESDELVYKNITDIYKVINFTKKIGAKLILANLLDEELPLYLQNQEGFIMLYKLFNVNTNNIFLDIGSDNIHPGVLTHKWYADQIITKFNL